MAEADATPQPPALERHYNVGQVAEMWGWSDDVVRRVFRYEAGVLLTKLPSIRARKRQRVSLRIPESVVLRVHAALSIR